MFGGGPWRPAPGGRAGCLKRAGCLTRAGCLRRAGRLGRAPEASVLAERGVPRRGSTYLGVDRPTSAWFGVRGVVRRTWRATSRKVVPFTPRSAGHAEKASGARTSALSAQRSAPAVTVPASPRAPALIGTSAIWYRPAPASSPRGAGVPLAGRGTGTRPAPGNEPRRGGARSRRGSGTWLSRTTPAASAIVVRGGGPGPGGPGPV